jgi:hypothetical protein
MAISSQVCRGNITSTSHHRVDLRAPSMRSASPTSARCPPALIVPALLIGAVLLWRGHSAGMVFGAGMNILAVVYMAALAFAGGFQANAGISGVSWTSFPCLELAVTSIIATVQLLWHYTAPEPGPPRPRQPA